MMNEMGKMGEMGCSCPSSSLRRMRSLRRSASQQEREENQREGEENRVFWKRKLGFDF